MEICEVNDDAKVPVDTESIDEGIDTNEVGDSTHEEYDEDRQYPKESFVDETSNFDEHCNATVDVVDYVNDDTPERISVVRICCFKFLY